MSAANPLYDEELHCRHCAYHGIKCKRAITSLSILFRIALILTTVPIRAFVLILLPIPTTCSTSKTGQASRIILITPPQIFLVPTWPTKLPPLFSVLMVIAALFTLSARTILSSATSIRMVSSVPSIARSKPKTFILRPAIPIQPKPVISLLCHKVLSFRRKLSAPPSPPIRL